MLKDEVLRLFAFHCFVAFTSDIAFYCYCVDIKMIGLFIYLAYYEAVFKSLFF